MAAQSVQSRDGFSKHVSMPWPPQEEYRNIVSIHTYVLL